MGASTLMPVKKRSAKRDLRDPKVTEAIDKAIASVTAATGDDTVVAIIVKRGNEAYTVTKTENWDELGQSLQSLVAKLRNSEPFEL